MMKPSGVAILLTACRGCVTAGSPEIVRSARATVAWGEQDGYVRVGILPPESDEGTGALRVQYLFRNCDSVEHRFAAQAFLLGPGIRYKTRDTDSDNATDYIHMHRTLLVSGESKADAFFLPDEPGPGDYRVECKYYDETVHHFRTVRTPIIAVRGTD